MQTVILDQEGNPRSEDWLRDSFGPVYVHRFEGQPAYRVVELREEEGPAEATVTVLDGEGQPSPGVMVEYRRSDGTAQQREQTDASGRARFPLPKGARYALPAEGPYLALIQKQEAPGDAVFGLGVRQAEHARHLNVVFQWSEEPVSAAELPAQPRLGEFESSVLARLDRIIELLQNR